MGIEIILYVAVAFGFYMAWSIGANDAANAMGTSVGSRAISFKEAVIIAAIFEFSGAFIAGASVTDTMRRGIIDPMLFNDPTIVGTSEGSILFMLGMLAALMSAAMWLHLAAMLGWPVSTTHSIVGAITGFGLVSVGATHIQWATLLTIMGSWVVSPLMGGILAFLIFTFIRRLIFDADNPVEAVKRWSPALVFPVFIVLALVLITKGLPGIDLAKYGIGLKEVWGISALVGLVGAVGTALLVRRMKTEEAGSATQAKFGKVETVFRYLQIVTACFVAFAHGSNDVANSIGPLAAIVGTMQEGVVTAKVAVPTWVLLLGAVGIVIGLATYGYKVIETIGTKITEITPSRGFAAEFGAASTILTGSALGLPISTTHTVVGAVIGVGFARGMNALHLGVIWNILKSWVYTIPVAAGLTIAIYLVLKTLWSMAFGPF
jgi:inorganic phosphate transporter, PiT family